MISPTDAVPQFLLKLEIHFHNEAEFSALSLELNPSHIGGRLNPAKSIITPSIDRNEVKNMQYLSAYNCPNTALWDQTVH